MKTSRQLLVAFACVVAAGSTGCTLEEQPVPALSGPSGLAHAFSLAASPALLPRDGSSQSVVTLTATDVTGGPLVGQRFRVDVTPSEAAPASTEVVTDATGRASFAVTAPTSRSAAASIAVTATAIGGFADEASRFLAVALSGSANTGDPVPSFTVSPESPTIQSIVTFDASATTDEGAACGSTCAYGWDFGEGTTKTGRVVTHTFTTPGSYVVTLTATDAVGGTATLQRVLAVSAVAAPTVTITVSPDPPFAGQAAVFNATANAAAGHRILRYVWDFGDGTTQTTTLPSVAKTYSAVGTFVVTVRVEDDLGQTGMGAKAFTVTHTIAQPVANLTVTPSSPAVGVQVTLSGAGSTVGSGATIVNYQFDPGDGRSPIDSATPTVLVTYGSAGTVIVRLTVTDSLGRQASDEVTVTVVP